MDIYLIRHTKTAAGSGLCYGQSDIGLADTFREEAEALQRKLPELTHDCAIYSSPLTRCLKLAGKLSRNLTADDRLLELNFGDWEGKRFDEIEPAVLHHWTEHFVDTPPPNGESFQDLYRRTGSFWQDMLDMQVEQVIVVTHVGAIRALLARVLMLPLANTFQLRIDHGSLHKLQHRSGYTMIDYLNRYE